MLPPSSEMLLPLLSQLIKLRPLFGYQNAKRFVGKPGTRDHHLSLRLS